MSTYFFKTNIDDTGTAVHIKPHLDRLEQSKDIDHWRVHLQDPNHVLEIETSKMSLQEVKEYLEDRGIMAEVAKQVKNNSHRTKG